MAVHSKWATPPAVAGAVVDVLAEPTAAERRKLLQELATPPDFWSVINAEFEFQIDVCAHAGNTKCDRYIDCEIDALSVESPWLALSITKHKMRNGSGLVWKEQDLHRAWCNPGFSNVLPWHQRAHAEAQKHPNNVVVVIGLAGGSQDWFKFAMENASEVRALADRVRYVPPQGIEDKGNSRESWVFVYRKKVIDAPALFVRDDWKRRVAA